MHLKNTDIFRSNPPIANHYRYQIRWFPIKWSMSRIFSLHSFHVKQLQCMIIDYLKRAYLSAWTMPLNGFSISHPLQNSFTPSLWKDIHLSCGFANWLLPPFFLCTCHAMTFVFWANLLNLDTIVLSQIYRHWKFSIIRTWF